MKNWKRLVNFSSFKGTNLKDESGPRTEGPKKTNRERLVNFSSSIGTILKDESGPRIKGPMKPNRKSLVNFSSSMGRRIVQVENDVSSKHVRSEHMQCTSQGNAIQYK